MFFVRIFNNFKWYQIQSFKSFEQALYYVKYNHYLHNIPLDFYQIVSSGLVYNINEDSLKKVKPIINK